MSSDDTRSYPRIRIALHWATVILVVVGAAAGLWISDLAPDDPSRLLGSRIHFAIGLATGIVLVARLLAWARTPAVAPLPVSEGHRKLVRAVHVALYVVGVAMVGAGMATSLMSGWPDYLSGAVASAPSFEDVPLREVHEVLVFTFFALVLAHVAGVINHERVHGGALRPMLGSRRG